MGKHRYRPVKLDQTGWLGVVRQNTVTGEFVRYVDNYGEESEAITSRLVVQA